jgi:hypothetical protein
MTRWLLALCLILTGTGCKIPRPVDDYHAVQAAAAAAKRPKDAGDAKVFDQLNAAGHDFKKPTVVDFYLYFPEEAAARGALQVLSGQGYTGDISQGNGEWLCHLKKSMVLNADSIDMERFKMRDLTVNSGGHYDGWGAAVKK